MAEALTYFVTLTLFGFVIQATARMRHEMLLLACIPPMFVALVVGFIMAVYAWETWETFGPAMVMAAAVLGFPVAWLCGRRYGPRDLLITIYLAWTVGMVCALVAFGFPDAPDAPPPPSQSAPAGIKGPLPR
ncbi:MAG TPA: hypothetical protein VN702_18520 [Acetobacteraceae bacterium]|nr:hypothetical protein [Acetobacteraceae bacterium]